MAKATTAIKDHMLVCDHVVSLETSKFWQELIQNITLRLKKVF